jgi:transcriptional regulator with XRE-family HTH domain
MSKTAYNFGVNLARICEQKGLTHREVAFKANMTEVRMSRYIHGQKEPTWVDVHNLATVLGCEPEYLMQDVNDG